MCSAVVCRPWALRFAFGPERIAEVEAVAHAEQIPLRVWPSGTQGRVYCPVVFVHPFDGANVRAIGYDISAESTRRRAMIRAADEGRPILSGRVRLAQEDGLSGEQPGFVLYYPLYRQGMPTTYGGRTPRRARRGRVRGLPRAAI